METEQHHKELLVNGNGHTDRMFEALQIAGIERLHPVLRRAGIVDLSEVEQLSPAEIQHVIPAVGTRRKLLNILSPECAAAGPVVFPLRPTPISSPNHNNTAFTRSHTLNSQGAAGNAHPMRNSRPHGPAKRSTQVHYRPVSPRARSRSESYMLGVKGRGTEFNTEVGGMAKEVARANRVHVQRSFQRETSLGSARRSRKSAATQEFSTPSRKSDASRSYRSPSRSSRAHSPPAAAVATELPPPPPEESASDRPLRHRPVFIKRDGNDVFTLLTSSKVNMPSDNAMKLEQLLRHHKLPTVESLRDVTEEELEAIGISEALCHRIKSAV